MKTIFHENINKWILLFVAIPIVLWSLSKVVPFMVSGLSEIGYRYFAINSFEKAGILKVFHQNSNDRKTVSKILFPLSRKSDYRFDYERFQLQLFGVIEVQKPGLYWIGTDSDDGSWIWVDGKKILDNGGLHSRRELMNSIFLKEGTHSIKIKFENLRGEAYLDIFWIPPNGPRQPLPFHPHSLARIFTCFYGLSILLFKISQYWTFFLVPILLYKLLFPFKQNKENPIGQG